MRALFAALPNSFANDFDGKKLAWRNEVQAKLRQMTAAEAAGSLPRSSARHQAYAAMAVGPFDPTLPLTRKAAVASTAFSKSELPTETVGGVVGRATALLADSGWVPPTQSIEGAAPGAVSLTAHRLKDRLVFHPRATEPAGRASAGTADSGWVTPNRFVESATPGTVSVSLTAHRLKDRLIFPPRAAAPVPSPMYNAAFDLEASI